MTNKIKYLNDTTECHVLDAIGVVSPTVRAVVNAAVSRPFNQNERRRVLWTLRTMIHRQIKPGSQQFHSHRIFVDWDLA